MKKLIYFVFLVLFAVSVNPQSSGQAVDAYGTRINISPELDYGALDRSYLSVANTLDKRAPRFGSLSSPVWHPDGKQIIYTNRSNIYSISPQGGKPRVIFESFYLYLYKDKRLILDQSINELIGFSPDGKLYLNRGIIDDPSVITVKEDGLGGIQGITIKRYSTVLDCLDTVTGKVRTISREGNMSALSPSGKYLAYTDSLKKIQVIDLTTGEKKTAGSCQINQRMSFTADERSILYTDDAGNSSWQLFRISVQGGNPQQVSFYSGGTTGLKRLLWDCTSDGEWALYSDDNDQLFSKSWTTSSGHQRSYTTKVVQLCAFNLRTSEVVVILPPTGAISYGKVNISPDGKKICFILRDLEAEDSAYSESLYYKELLLPPAQVGPTGVANTPVFAFCVKDNFPNPFNPSTTISFSLPETGRASLVIYNASGQKVRELVTGILNAGRHSVVWDGRDGDGKMVSSGVYISRLTMKDRAASNRMLLLK